MLVLALGERVAALARSPEADLAELVARSKPEVLTVSVDTAASELVLSMETTSSASWLALLAEPPRPRSVPFSSPSQRSTWRARDRAAGRRRPGR